ncbi:hypothetical protein MPEAHAMD_2591 [Methylobacterium frigidaeris]|uniref:Uncharacterized protein n=1 Tax=Methylobacterium frigidaeris TaxID=2038277 RepID=A0AA37M4E8_9HYPH|nr:hypothetical protein MPEAHAMD_2591 [Methylobacterium frigidaeris]
MLTRTSPSSGGGRPASSLRDLEVAWNARAAAHPHSAPGRGTFSNSDRRLRLRRGGRALLRPIDVSPTPRSGALHDRACSDGRIRGMKLHRACARHHAAPSNVPGQSCAGGGIGHGLPTVTALRSLAHAPLIAFIVSNSYVAAVSPAAVRISTSHRTSPYWALRGDFSLAVSRTRIASPGWIGLRKRRESSP